MFEDNNSWVIDGCFGFMFSYLVSYEVVFFYSYYNLFMCERLSLRYGYKTKLVDKIEVSSFLRLKKFENMKSGHVEGDFKLH